MAKHSEENRDRLSDISDHLRRENGRLTETRELLRGLLNSHLTTLSVAQNADMRKMSAWAAIITTPTLIAGVYGMNFRHMPELESKAGYPLTLLGMMLICCFLYWRFQKAGWMGRNRDEEK